MALLVGLTGLESVTVPVNKRWILTDVDVYEGGGVNPGVVLVRNAGGGTIAQLGPQISLTDPGASFGPGSYQWRGHQVLYAGESLSFQNVGGGGADVTASGYELDDPGP